MYQRRHATRLLAGCSRRAVQVESEWGENTSVTYLPCFYKTKKKKKKDVNCNLKSDTTIGFVCVTI